MHHHHHQLLQIRLHPSSSGWNKHVCITTTDMMYDDSAIDVVVVLIGDMNYYMIHWCSCQYSRRCNKQCDMLIDAPLCK